MPKRVLLKVSGRFCAHKDGSGVAVDVFRRVAREISEALKFGNEVAVVIGGGNLIYRSDLILQRLCDQVADRMGMLATVQNGLVLAHCLEGVSVPCHLFSAFEIAGIARQADTRLARHRLRKQEVVIFVGGTGMPFVTTDTTAVIRALEVDAELVLKATDVGGVYDEDPKKNWGACHHEQLSLQQAISMGVGVMDRGALDLALQKKMPIRVFSMKIPGNIERAIRGESIGTLLTP